jgi:hypothetical protein
MSSGDGALQAELQRLRAERQKGIEHEQKLGALLNTANAKLAAFEKALSRAEEVRAHAARVRPGRSCGPPTSLAPRAPADGATVTRMPGHPGTGSGGGAAQRIQGPAAHEHPDAPAAAGEAALLARLPAAAAAAAAVCVWTARRATVSSAPTQAKDELRQQGINHRQNMQARARAAAIADWSGPRAAALQGHRRPEGAARRSAGRRSGSHDGRTEGFSSFLGRRRRGSAAGRAREGRCGGERRSSRCTHAGVRMDGLD